MQRKLLISEGIIVSDEFTLDMNRYRFIADDVFLKKLKLEDTYIQTLHAKYFIVE
jgi:hypothetical protein